MKDHLIVLGDSRSGKSMLVNSLANYVDRRLIMSARIKSCESLPDRLSASVQKSVDPELIVIDDIDSVGEISKVLESFGAGMIVSRHGVSRTIRPRFVFICDEYIRPSSIRAHHVIRFCHIVSLQYVENQYPNGL